MEQALDDRWWEKITEWCFSIVGSHEFLSDDQRYHGRSGIHRLQTSSGFCYLKIHQDIISWEREVHGYEQWAGAFGARAPNLIAIHPDKPYALLVSELPGQMMREMSLTAKQEQQIWCAAGQALRELHDFATGEYFGAAKRDGSPAGAYVRDATEYVLAEFDRLIDVGTKGGYLSNSELRVIRRIVDRVSACEGEQPVPCHRDYGPDNWLVTYQGIWSGVIDFEFSNWDLRVVDFSRYPDWEWMYRPDLLRTLFEGYGRSLNSVEELQCLILRCQYALGAIVWGHQNAFYGFEEEGRKALKYMAPLV